MRRSGYGALGHFLFLPFSLDASSAESQDSPSSRPRRTCFVTHQSQRLTVWEQSLSGLTQPLTGSDQIGTASRQNCTSFGQSCTRLEQTLPAWINIRTRLRWTGTCLDQSRTRLRQKVHRFSHGVPGCGKPVTRRDKRSSFYQKLFPLGPNKPNKTERRLHI